VGATQHFQQYFRYILLVSFIGRGNRRILNKTIPTSH